MSEAQILAGHFLATRDRATAATGPILVLHDTTEFSFKREDIKAVGMTYRGVAGADWGGKLRHYTACGILMHSSLAVTIEGLPLGLLAAKFWTRKKFKGTNALKKMINPTHVPIEQKESIRWIENLRQSTELLAAPTRCVHIGDRESDIYELFCAAHDAGTHFLVRTCVDRLAVSGKHMIAKEMAEVRCKGLHRVEVRDRRGRLVQAVLELRFRRIRLLPPIGKQSRYPQMFLTVLHATECGRPPQSRPDQLETDYRFTRHHARHGAGKALLVRAALEDRNLPQSSEVWLSGGALKTAHRTATGQSARDILRSGLAHLLANDAEPFDAPRRTDTRIYAARN